MTNRPTGAILYHGPSALDGSPIVAIMTGLQAKSANPKTGNMAQVWILRADVNPIEAARLGADVSICGGCPHRGRIVTVKRRKKNIDRSCYVTLVNAPRAVFKAYAAGRYAETTDLATLGADRTIRIGAYGDPAAVPLAVWQALTSRAKDWTGYTHQWRTATGLRGLVMASVDSVAEAQVATDAGWRWFLVNTGQALPGLKAITCPASAEAGKRTTCAACRLCNGARTDDRRANITIAAHGSVAVHFYRRSAA